MYFTTWNSKGFVVLPHGFRIWRFEEAIHLAVGIVKELDLTNTKLVGLVILSFLCDLLDGFIWQFQVLVEIHELRHGLVPLSRMEPPGSI
jgi:hypothetical protein